MPFETTGKLGCSATASPRPTWLLVEKFVAFLWQIAPIVPVLPTVPTYKPFAVNKMPVECHLHTVEVVGSNPAAPTNSFNNLDDVTVEAFATFCGKSSDDVISSPPFVSIAYTDPTIDCTLSGNSCMYSLAVVSGLECLRCA